MVAIRASAREGPSLKDALMSAKADMCGARAHVRFAPNSDRESGHAANGHVCFTPESEHVQCTSSCLLWAKSRHVRCNRACPLYRQKRPFGTNLIVQLFESDEVEVKRLGPLLMHRPCVK